MSRSPSSGASGTCSEIHSFRDFHVNFLSPFLTVKNARGEVWSKASWPKGEIRQRCCSEREKTSVCMYVWVNELLGCIDILKCDWQRRSLLVEIVNRVEPVICSRQPWKGTADSQGSYWEIQRCCMTDLGMGPRHTEPARRACSPINADQCAFTFSVGSSAAIPLQVLTFLQPFKPFFVSTLLTVRFSFFSLCSAFSNMPGTLLILNTT